MPPAIHIRTDARHRERQTAGGMTVPWRRAGAWVRMRGCGRVGADAWRGERRVGDGARRGRIATWCTVGAAFMPPATRIRTDARAPPPARTPRPPTRVRPPVPHIGTDAWSLPRYVASSHRRGLCAM